MFSNVKHAFKRALLLGTTLICFPIDLQIALFSNNIK